MTEPRLHVDWTRCDGHGLCYALAPDLLARDEWGFPVVRAGAAGDDAAPTKATRTKTTRTLRRVAAACPALALRLDA